MLSSVRTNLMQPFRLIRQTKKLRRRKLTMVRYHILLGTEIIRTLSSSIPSINEVPSGFLRVPSWDNSLHVTPEELSDSGSSALMDVPYEIDEGNMMISESFDDLPSQSYFGGPFHPDSTDIHMVEPFDAVFPHVWESHDQLKLVVNQITLYPIPLIPPDMIGHSNPPAASSHNIADGHPIIQRAFLQRAYESGFTSWIHLADMLRCFCETNPFLGMPYFRLIADFILPLESIEMTLTGQETVPEA
jgi:hypothetical protein